MVQNGGWLVSKDGTAGHRRHARRTSQALQYVKSLLEHGLAKLPEAARRRLGR